MPPLCCLRILHKKMNLFLLLLTVAVSADKLIHEDVSITGCSETDGEDMYGLDGDEMVHTDFQKKVAVMTVPAFIDISYDLTSNYQTAVGNLDACRRNLATDRHSYKDPPEQIDSPVSSVYSKEDVILGTPNTLICHVTGFFPPPISVTWTCNNENMTEGVSVSQYYPNRDGTFNMFSTLSFTPQEGDIYSCTVKHKGLQEPQTRTWEVDVAQPSVGPSVFCGVGLAVGLMGVATGTFFLIKGNNCK